MLFIILQQRFNSILHILMLIHKRPINSRMYYHDLNLPFLKRIEKNEIISKIHYFDHIRFKQLTEKLDQFTLILNLRSFTIFIYFIFLVFFWFIFLWTLNFFFLFFIWIFLIFLLYVFFYKFLINLLVFWNCVLIIFINILTFLLLFFILVYTVFFIFILFFNNLLKFIFVFDYLY